MRKMISLVFVLAACADNGSEGECQAPTVVGGERVDCDGGRGICLDTERGLACVPRCEESGGPLCEGGMWYSMPLDGESICYCFEPDGVQ